jgi:hypothetical protein
MISHNERQARSVKGDAQEAFKRGFRASDFIIYIPFSINPESLPELSDT